MNRNTSTEDKDTELLSNLKGLFGKKLNLARIKFVTLFILALCKTRKVTYTALAIAFDNKTCKDSNVKRIRNFMKAANFTMELVSKLIFNLCPKKNKKLYAWNFFNNLKPYQGYHYDRIMQYKGEYCYLSGVKTIENNGKIGYCILISFNKSDEGLEKYKERWQIETLFKGLKSSGFNVEDTHLRDLERIERLMLLVMTAFVWCYKIGDYIDTQFKAIRIKPDGKRVISVLRYGLDYLSEYLFRGVNKFEINYLQFLSCT